MSDDKSVGAGPREWTYCKQFGLTPQNHSCFIESAPILWAANVEPIIERLQTQYETKAQMYLAVVKGYETKCALYVKEKERADRAETVLRELKGTEKTIAQLLLERDELARQLDAQESEHSRVIIATRNMAADSHKVKNLRIERLEAALAYAKMHLGTHKGERVDAILAGTWSDT